MVADDPSFKHFWSQKVFTARSFNVDSCAFGRDFWEKRLSVINVYAIIIWRFIHACIYPLQNSFKEIHGYYIYLHSSQDQSIILNADPTNIQ